MAGLGAAVALVNAFLIFVRAVCYDSHETDLLIFSILLSVLEPALCEQRDLP